MREASNKAKVHEQTLTSISSPCLGRYKGVQEQQFWQERLGTRDVDELGIDTNASFLAAPVVPLPAPETLQPQPAPAQPKRQAPPQHAGRHGPAAEKAEKKGGIPIIIVPSGCVGAPCAVLRHRTHPARLVAPGWARKCW